MFVVVEMAQSTIVENARIEQNQDEYHKHYNALVDRYDATKAMMSAITNK